nr:hypothetical protein [Pseudopedobacter sp.]
MKKSIKNKVKEGLNYLFIVFWGFSFFSKVLDFKSWHSQMHNQIFEPPMSELLTYVLPAVFLLMAILLAYKESHLFGLYCSVFLLLLFNGYILLVWFNLFDRIPCSCAAIIHGFTWLQQFLFNTAALMLLGWAIFLNKNEGRWV